MKRVWKSRWISTHLTSYLNIKLDQLWINFSRHNPDSTFSQRTSSCILAYFFFFEVSEGPSIPGISEPERSVVVRSDRRVTGIAWREFFGIHGYQKMPIVQKVTVTVTVFWDEPKVWNYARNDHKIIYKYIFIYSLWQEVQQSFSSRIPRVLHSKIVRHTCNKRFKGGNHHEWSMVHVEMCK